MSPIVANIVLQDLEERALSIININLPFLFQYVDNIIWRPADKIDLIVKTFNSLHKKLQFTIEIKGNRNISFLDLSLKV